MRSPRGVCAGGFSHNRRAQGGDIHGSRTLWLLRVLDPPLFHFGSLRAYTTQSSFKTSRDRRLCAREEGSEGREGDTVLCHRSS